MLPYESILLEEAQRASISTTYQRFPIRDLSVPANAERLTEILFAIDEGFRGGGTVYLHCWGGVGRTGLVVACWLQEHGRTPKDALAELGQKWRTVDKIYRKPDSPETPAQVAWVKSWPRRRRGVQQWVIRDRYRGLFWAWLSAMRSVPPWSLKRRIRVPRAHGLQATAH